MWREWVIPTTAALLGAAVVAAAVIAAPSAVAAQPDTPPERQPVPGVGAQPKPADGASGRAAVIPRQDLAAFLDGFVRARMLAHHVAGVTAAVVHDGALIFAEGYGYADFGSERPVVAERTLFRPGSISKTFTWTAVMQLWEQGRVDLDADIRRYLPNLDIPETFAEPITLAHLMAHTPGFEDSAMGHLFMDDPQEVPSLLEYLRAYQPQRVRPPGTLPAYSNYGTAVAGLIVENVSGLPWESYVERNLLEPLGMDHSTFREPWGDQRSQPMPARLRDHVSRGYVYRDGRYRPGGFTFIGHIGPAGAMATTATDMARWMLAHLNYGRLGDARILAPDTARLMQRRHFGLDSDLPGMAHGFIESHVHGYRAIGHGGGTIHFFSDMQLIPELGLGVFVSTNTSGGGAALIDGFVRALVARYFPPGPLSRAEQPRGEPARPLAEYGGAYLSTRRPYTTVERLFMTSGALVSPTPDGALLAASAMGDTRLEPLGGDTFVSAETGELVKFTRDAAGGIDAMLLPVPIMVMEKVGPLGRPGVLYGILAASAFVLLCAVIGAWLRRKRPVEQTPAEAWAARTVIATALVWIGFYGLAAFGLAPLGDDFSRVFFDFPTPMFLAALGLGLAGAVLTLAAGLMLYPVWQTGSWPLWRRIRHTGVVLAALATLLVLRNLNAIGFHYLPG